MAPRNSELPEGTDHIIKGASQTRGDGGRAGSGFIGSGGASAQDDDTGGALSTTGAARPLDEVKTQLREGATNLRDQATTKVREYAVEGKGRATSALDDFSKVVNEAADSIDDKLGEQYGQYARQAADAVSGFADTLRRKEVDELYDDAVTLVRKSPAVAIGIAAAVGFALVRLVKSGLPENEGETDVAFTPDPTLDSPSQGTTGASAAGGPTSGTAL